MDNFKEVLEKVKLMSKGKIQHEAGMANSIQILKRSMVRSEESRLLNDMNGLKSSISQLNQTNENLIKELKIKTIPIIINESVIATSVILMIICYIKSLNNYVKLVHLTIISANLQNS